MALVGVYPLTENAPADLCGVRVRGPDLPHRGDRERIWRLGRVVRVDPDGYTGGRGCGRDPVAASAERGRARAIPAHDRARGNGRGDRGGGVVPGDRAV